MRTIEVTGHATLELVPDNVIFTINIQEYWQEEFEEGKEYKDYRTKVDIVSIENAVVAELKAMNINLSQLTLDRSGNYWRQQGKDFLVSKTIDVKLASPKEANEITNRLQTRGIQSMNIKEMKNSQLEEYKIKTKAQAVLNAKTKAEILTASLNEKIGKVLHIIEVDRNVHIAPKVQAMARSAMLMDQGGMDGIDYENYGLIIIKEEVRVIFEIK